MKKPKILKAPSLGVVASIIAIAVLSIAVIAAIPSGTFTGTGTTLTTNGTIGAGEDDYMIVTDSGGEINTVDDIRIKIPAIYTNSEWNDIGDTATARIPIAPSTLNTTGTVATAVTYEESVPASGRYDILVIDVTTNFTDGDKALLRRADIATIDTEAGLASFDYSVDGGATWSSGSSALIRPEQFGKTFTSILFPNDVNFLIDQHNTFGHCDNAYPLGLGGTWAAGSSTCTVSNQVNLVDKQIWVTHGTTLDGYDEGGDDNKISLTFTSNNSNLYALELVGKAGDPILVEGIDISSNLSGTYRLQQGVNMTGPNITLQNSSISGTFRDAGVLVAEDASNFLLDNVTTSNLDNDGVLVEFNASSGQILNHTSNGNGGDGIELQGTTSVEVSDSQLTNNGGYGLHVRDIAWSALYPIVGDPLGDATTVNTDALVDGNIMDGNTTADVGVDVTDGSAWDGTQGSTTNAYVTINEINGTLPGAQTSPSTAVPEFHEYVLMLTLIIALGFMYKKIPQMGSGMRAA